MWKGKSLAGTTKLHAAALKPGDSYLCRPGLAHKLINESDEDFELLVIAKNPSVDAVYCPDSGKLGMRESVWGSLLLRRF